MKVIILLSDEDIDKNFFDLEMRKILKLYNKEMSEFEFILPDCQTSFMPKEWCKNYHYNYINFGMNNKSYLNCVEAMTHYCKNEYSLLINFEENYIVPKKKNKLFEKISQDIQIYNVFYDREIAEILCCDQPLIWKDEIEEGISIYVCEACRNYYIITDELINIYILENIQFKAYRKIRFFKGEYNNGE